MTRTRSTTVSLTVATMLVLAGCSDNPEGQTGTPAPTIDPVTTAEPAPTEPAATTQPPDDHQITTAPPELSAEEQDQADIEETLVRYTRALDDAFNGDASVEGIYPFSRDTAREQWVTQVMYSETQGFTSTGLTELEIVEVTIDGDTAAATACADVSAVDVFDEDGQSINTEARLDQTLNDFILERDDSAQVGWYIVEDTNRDEPCEG
ncbi:hypothetical protein [Ornithinimicrobium sufpigmenti]|uniref:hypothetical protein n=1 Tax=Ornithinimicrobium sufpigmenti TaxID=2508882 RepID=UPI00104C1AAE|nr:MULTISPECIES: hypothetical protein [unclassified Ornithinimicrobium]